MTPHQLTPGDHSRSLHLGEVKRSYLIHLPPGYDAARPASVVLAFHGGGTNAAFMAEFCGLNEKADAEGFIAVYPNGTGRVERALTFNAGNCCGHAMRHQVDDVGFVRSLLDDLAGIANVDVRRVFATGMSNGAMVCYRLASELSERIAAVAPVAGPMGTATCRPTRPVSVMHFHGTADEFAPFEGGVGRRSLSRTDFYSVEHTMRAWVAANGCPTTPQISKQPSNVPPGPAGNLPVERRAWSPGDDGSEVVLFVIEGGGHTWPGREAELKMLGRSTREISANDLMWEFFERHPMT